LRFLRANNVLHDCEIALELLEQERKEDLWRVQWVGAIALIRAVGHVLRHVDRRELPQFAERIDAAFESWKVGEEHRIFREFIEQERNNVLKEYRSSIHDLGVVRLVVEGKPGQSPVMWEPTADGNYVEYFELDENMYRPRLTGFMEGEDARDIYREAIHWWRSELSKIVE
jgi:hypothetical protein